MRNVRALCGLAVFAAAFGCGGGSDQSGRGAQAPSQATTEPPPSETPQGQAPSPPSEGEMGPSTAAPPTQPTPGTGGAQMAPMISSNDLLMGTFVCMLGPLTLDRSAMGSTGGSMGTGSSMGQGSMGQGSSGQGSMGQGSSGQGSMGQGSSGQGSTGQGSMGQGSSGQGYTAGQPGSAAEQCVAVAQAANVMPTSLAMGDASAIDTVRRTLDSRLSVEGASPDVSNNTLAFFDKGVAAAKEARTATESIYSGSSPHGVGGGPSSGSSSGHSHSGSTSNKPDSKQSSSSRPGADEIRAHRALGELYQFGRNLGATETGTAAQALSWVIAVDRFEAVADLPTQQKALAAEPLFAVILNVPPPSGARANAWNDYLAAAARSAGGTTPGAGAVGGGPSAGSEKANMKQVARGAEERMQVLGQQLPPSSPLRSEVDRTIADLRKMETQSTQPSTQGTQQQQQPRSTPKKPPSQQQNQPKQTPQNQSPQNQKQQK